MLATQSASLAADRLCYCLGSNNSSRATAQDEKEEGPRCCGRLDETGLLFFFWHGLVAYGVNPRRPLTGPYRSPITDHRSSSRVGLC